MEKGNYYHTLGDRVAQVTELIEEGTPARHSLHECLGFMREEYVELEQEIFKKVPDLAAIEAEAMDLMVTAMRLHRFAYEARMGQYEALKNRLTPEFVETFNNLKINPKS